MVSPGLGTRSGGSRARCPGFLMVWMAKPPQENTSMHKILPLAAAFAVVAPLTASAVVIDSFNDGAFSLTVAPTPQARPDQVAVSGNSMIGGRREAFLNLRGRGVVDARTLDAVAGVAPEGLDQGGVLAVSDGARAFSDFTLRYNNLGSGVDLTEGGTQNAFLLDYKFFQGFSRVEAQVFTDGRGSRGPVFVTDNDNDRIVGDASRTNSQQKVIAFEDFFGGADFTDVDGIAFFFQSSDTNLGGATDFELDEIRTIPEPAGVALLAAGVGLLAARRRRG